MRASSIALLVNSTKLAAIAALSLASASTSAQVVYTNGFETGLGSRLSISTIGTFSASPGIIATANFGSTQAFSFGRSTCAASCFGSFVTTLTLDLSAPTFISSISFKEMELFGNWGSNGSILLDNVSYAGDTHFGRVPDNDHQPDNAFRTHNFLINATATKLQFQVVDITRESAILIDNLVVSSVPELPIWSALVLGIPGVLAARARRRHNRRDA